MKGFDNEHVAFLESLNKNLVKYVIIGGHASIYHGVNRNTGDLDILIEPSVENGHKLLKALHSLKLDVPEITDQEWTSQLVLSFGFEPDAIDILNRAGEKSFLDKYDIEVLKRIIDRK